MTKKKKLKSRNSKKYKSKSRKNKKPNKAVINGIAARQRRVIAAEVLVIDQINVIIAKARPVPPIIPEMPIFL